MDLNLGESLFDGWPQSSGSRWTCTTTTSRRNSGGQPHGILLGRDQHRARGQGAALQAAQHRRGIVAVIGEGHRLDDLRTQRLRSVAKNFPGRPIPAKASTFSPASARPGAGAAPAAPQSRRPSAGQHADRRLALGRRVPTSTTAFGPRQPVADRLAQRPGRDQPTIAETRPGAKSGIDYQDRRGP